MKSLPYESATSGDKALTEIQSILGQFGCGTFGTTEILALPPAS